MEHIPVHVEQPECVGLKGTDGSRIHIAVMSCGVPGIAVVLEAELLNQDASGKLAIFARSRRLSPLYQAVVVPGNMRIPIRPRWEADTPDRFFC